MEYTIIDREMMHELTSAVNELIRQGWEPTGGVVLRGGYLLQALVRREDNIPETKPEEEVA